MISSHDFHGSIKPLKWLVVNGVSHARTPIGLFTIKHGRVRGQPIYSYFFNDWFLGETATEVEARDGCYTRYTATLRGCIEVY